MTYGEVLTEARRLARVSTQGLSDANALTVVSEAIRRFCMDVGGYTYVRGLQVSGYFTPETFEGFHLKIVGSTNNDVDSDIAVTSTGGSELTGTEMAAELQTQIRAAIGSGTEDLTVAWTNFYFKVDGIDSTSIEISAPSDDETYKDATDKYFGGVDTGTTSITGDFPRGCTVGSALPTNFRDIISVVWDRTPLTEAPESMFINPQTTGTPGRYYIRNWTRIMLFPVPTTQKDLVMAYNGLPTLSASPATSTDLPTEIPTEYHQAIANRVAAEMLRGTFEHKYANDARYEYEKYVERYKVNKANLNTEARRGTSGQLLPYSVGW